MLVAVVKVLLVALCVCLCVCLDVRLMKELRGLVGCKAPVLVLLLVAVCVCLEVAGVRSMMEIRDSMQLL